MSPSSICVVTYSLFLSPDLTPCSLVHHQPLIVVIPLKSLTGSSVGLSEFSERGKDTMGTSWVSFGLINSNDQSKTKQNKNTGDDVILVANQYPSIFLKLCY